MEEVEIMKYWILVNRPENFEVMKAKNIAVMKVKRKSFAQRVEPAIKQFFISQK